MHSKHASRRRHGAELKDKVLAACDEPGASVAAVAFAHGLNANLVHKWRRGRGVRPLSSPAAGFVALSSSPPVDAAAAFVPLQLEMPRAAPADIRLELHRGAPADLRLELHRGAATVIVTWPAQEPAACGRWLREWLA